MVNLSKDQLKSYAYIFIMILISSFLFSFGIKMFLSSAKGFSSGLGALPQLITYIVKNEIMQKMFSVLYLAVNIPLIIIFYFFAKKKFVILTTIWLLVQTAWGVSMNYIPGIKDADPFSLGIYTKNDILSQGTKITDEAVGMVKKEWANIIQPLFGGLIVGVGLGLAWKIGASSGGADFITYYISDRYKKPVGNIAFIVSTSIALLMIVIQISLNKMPWKNTNLASKIFGPITWGTMLYITTQAIIVNIIYPKYKKVSLEISSTKIEKILIFFKENHFSHGYIIIDNKSGYTGKKKKMIKTTILYLEQKTLVKQLQEIDPDIWISSSISNKVYGKFNTEIKY